MANPTLLTSPIAENGDKNVIPASTGATTGLLDQEHGFQQINELPLQAGGLPPQRKDFNGAFNLLSKLLFYVQKGWQFEFDENQDYYAGCVVKDTDGLLYEALNDVPASSTHPKDDSTNWKIAFGGSFIVASSIGQNGYLKLAKGMIWQWGIVDETGWSADGGLYSKDFYFPISFSSSASYSVVCCTRHKRDVNGKFQKVNVIDGSYAKAYADIATTTICWLAMGF